MSNPRMRMIRKMAHTLRLSRAEFESLPEYSATLPTGTTIGKRWKRLDGAHDLEAKAKGMIPIWLVGEYIEIGRSDLVGVRWYRPVVICPAGTDGAVSG